MMAVVVVVVVVVYVCRLCRLVRLLHSIRVERLSYAFATENIVRKSLKIEECGGTVLC